MSVSIQYCTIGLAYEMHTKNLVLRLELIRFHIFGFGSLQRTVYCISFFYMYLYIFSCGLQLANVMVPLI